MKKKQRFTNINVKHAKVNIPNNQTEGINMINNIRKAEILAPFEPN